jgi:hypothetical protein
MSSRNPRSMPPADDDRFDADDVSPDVRRQQELEVEEMLDGGTDLPTGDENDDRQSER